MKNSIICFGEVLWDVYKDHKVAGGAPMNVVFHAKNLGIDAQLISAVGSDELGEAMKNFLHQNEIATDLISTNASFPTGSTQVITNETGSASYEILTPAAWDFLYSDENRKNLVAKTQALVFGSLICRDEHNLTALLSLMEKAAINIFDVNFRAPYYKQSVIEKLLHKADIVKMNEEELAEISQWYQKKQSIEKQMAFIKDKFSIFSLLLTTGKDGAYCLHDNSLYFQEGMPVKVKDTVGCGDAFLAAFTVKRLAGVAWKECLEFACAAGALVATHIGGTPVINNEMVLNFLQNHKKSKKNMKSIQLNQQNISTLKDSLPCPIYDRKTVKTGIIHIGCLLYTSPSPRD